MEKTLKEIISILEKAADRSGIRSSETAGSRKTGEGW